MTDRVSDRTVRELAVKAGVDPRTIRRALAKMAMRGEAGVRAARVVAEWRGQAKEQP